MRDGEEGKGGPGGVQINVRVDAALKAAVDRYCRSRGVIVSHFVQEALLDRLEELEDIEDLKRIRHEPTRPLAEISRTAEKQLSRLRRAEQEHVVRRMLALAADPFPRGVRKLAGYDDVYRVRAGRYRILYSVDRRELVIIILKVGHRREVCR